jgi:hypothetical protein
MKADVSSATVVTLYLLTSSNAKKQSYSLMKTDTIAQYIFG